MLSLARLGRRLFGAVGDKKLASIRSLVARINELEAGFHARSDAGLQETTHILKSRAQGGEQLDQLLPEAFANCREALARTLGLRAFDVQLMGGIILHQGNIAEMATGEGKTVVAVFAAYLNSLNGKGMHVATINEYLARRDAEWMGKAYAALGVTTGLIHPAQLPVQRRVAYRADVTYSTYNEFAFDYLRDNMKSSIEDVVQRGHACAIIDEADSVLIDEARTPLIISGPSQDRSELYIKVNEIISRVQPHHFDQNREHASVSLTEEGNEFAERELRQAGFLHASQSLYANESQAAMLHIVQALRAHMLYHRDQHYIIHNNEVVLIDSSTGRMMPTRRLSDGLHQAIEAKEGLPIKAETMTLASVTVQNFFRLYSKLSGMTGTATTDAEELQAVYNLNVVPLPANKPVLRQDDPDMVYRTESEKKVAILEIIRDAHSRGQPVLLGTTSIAESERLSLLLQAEGIAHNVLNANHHERESQIIADAGRLGAVTIATNMAGRGTDIQLGGNLQIRLQTTVSANLEAPAAEIGAGLETEHAQEKSAVTEAGGLLVLGTERHESRRIDNQLRGRSGRQGDPGRTRFILSLEDELLKKVEAKWLDNILSKSGPGGNREASQADLIKALNRIQARIEGRNFQIRMQLLKFDDVINEQRKHIYAQRLELMSARDLSEFVSGTLDQFIGDLLETHLPDNSYAEQWDSEGLEAACRDLLTLELPVTDWVKEDGIDRTDIHSRILDAADAMMQKKAESLGPELMRNLEKQIILQVIDSKWREHWIFLEQLRSVIGFRSYAKRDPLSEYKIEALEHFRKLLADIRREVSSGLAQIRPISEDEQFAAMGRLALQDIR
ncbi:MAG: preprotein translocase subunit SecA [Aestuariivirga sp.]